jgi:hypothetical protein
MRLMRGNRGRGKREEIEEEESERKTRGTREERERTEGETYHIISTVITSTMFVNQLNDLSRRFDDRRDELAKKRVACLLIRFLVGRIEMAVQLPNK